MADSNAAEAANYRVAVVGARSQIGRYLLPRLRVAGYAVVAVGREEGAIDNVPVHTFDSQTGRFSPGLDHADAVISLAPLPIIDKVIPMVLSLGAQRVIAFGSTGTRMKARSSSPVERDFVAQQTIAEGKLRTLSEANAIAWTLFRPTMVYGADMDLNVSFIRAMVRRFGVFPMPRGARGLRQPVHADDLAAACVAALRSEPAFNRDFDLGGGEQLEYEEMVRRIFIAEGKRPLIIEVPAQVLYLAIEVMNKLPRYRFTRREMIERMFDDLVVDNTPATAAFGYSARAFSLQTDGTTTLSSG